MKNIKEATIEELAQVIPEQVAKNLHARLHEGE